MGTQGGLAEKAPGAVLNACMSVPCGCPRLTPSAPHPAAPNQGTSLLAQPNRRGEDCVCALGEGGAGAVLLL